MHPATALPILALSLLLVLPLPLAPPAEPPSPADRADAAEGGAGEWPPLSQAWIRPGVRLSEPSLQRISLCSANFIFADRDNASLYLGTAAHCVDRPIGTRVPIHGEDPTPQAWGTLVYNSWETLRRTGPIGGANTLNNDFALIRIDPEYRGLVHPSTYRYGGPVGLAEPEDVSAGHPVVAYGNSPVRRVEEARWQEGCVVQRERYLTYLNMAPPMVPGDSGAPILSRDGLALGVFSRIPPPHVDLARASVGGNVAVTNIAAALEFARTYADVDVVLATWPEVAAPVLPSIPCST